MNIKRTNSKHRGALLICLAASLWGLDGVVLTPRLYNLNVSYVVFMLHALPFLLMNIFLFKEYKNLSKFTKNDFIGFSLVAIFGGAIGTLAIVRALFLVNFEHLTVVVLLQKLQPVFAITLASIILKEKLNPKFLLWAAIAVCGGYFLTFGTHLPNFKVGENTTQAALYALLAAFSFGSATVFSKSILNKFNFRTATFYRYGFTTILMLIIILSNGAITQIQHTTAANWMFFSIITLTSGSGALLMYYYGLKSVNAIIATICELCFPISAVLFDYLFNDKTMSTTQWISAAIMLFAIIRLTRSR